MAENTENTKNRLTRMLLSKSRRAKYIRLFAVLAACVAVVVAVVLHQNGVAMTHEEKVLTCPVEGVVAHTHNESCYDADGNLVCTLPERELHAHTEDCYTQTRELTCGLEESEGHTHTDACYDPETGELTCGKEESEGHKHSDACYTETSELTCGQEEVTEEHVHGPGCFTMVEVEDEADAAEVKDQSAVEANKSQAMPAQQFDEDILDDKGNLWVHVSVKAPEGAFPEGTTMRIAPLDAESVRTKVEDALKKDNENVAGARGMKAVDIKFINAEGNEIEPAVDVEVKITSDTVRDLDNPVLVHVDKDENKDAEVLKKVDVVNKDEEDKTEATKDTLKFESNTFSPYVIAEPVTISANVITASGEAYQITVSYGTDAAIPTDAKLEVSEVKKDAEGYDEYAAQTAKALNTGEDTFSHIRMFDITIKDSYGNKIEPAAPVEVQIDYKGNGIEKEQELKVVHLADTGAEVIDPKTEGSDGAVDELSFTAKSFSIYSIVSWKETQDLNGKSFAIVQLSTSPIANTDIENNTRYLGRALQSVVDEGRYWNNGWHYYNNGLKAANVAAEEHESGEYLVTTNKNGTLGENLASADAITQWTFEAVANSTDRYYIKSGNNYLNIGQNGQLSISTNKQEITVEEADGRVRLRTTGNDNKKYVRSSVSRGTSNNNGDDPYFNSGGKDDDYDLLTLCQIEEVVENTYPAYTGTKIGANELTDGQSLIIYQTVYNEAKGAYEDYVIDGNGKAVKAYDRGNEVTLYSQTCPVWMVSVLKDGNGQETGYYLFKNEETGLILHPLADGTLVKDPDSNSSTADGVALAGKKQGEYTSTIEYWDQSVNKWVGYQFVNGNTGIELTPGMDDNSQKFSFAVRKTDDESALHTVSTVDSKSQGINIHMFDYGSRNDIASVTGSDGYGVAVLPNVHVNYKLENGYPKFTNGKSGSQLFTPNNTNGYYKGDANNLFLASVYNSTGYYEYSSFNNFAKYDQNTGNFTLYAEQGTPYPTASNFYDRRGNFFPYNSLNTGANADRGQSLYNGDGKLLDYENPARGGTLYGINSLNHYFGMSIDFSFLMPREGKINDNPVIYEFNGDDDLWVYVDGVLLLDIGGVHDSWSGTINFATGEITYGHDQQGRSNKMPTTIKACFEQAGVFPDGTKWDDKKVDQYFKGNTFVNYGSHTFNMFFMEHGANCSTLETRFNLPVIEKGKVVVAKELANTSQTDYANVSFAYQLFTKDGNNSIPVNSDATKTDIHGNTTDLGFSNNVKFNGSDTAYDNVFYLKPGEKATFNGIPENQEYYVQEIGINNHYYDEIRVNDVKIEGVTVEGQNGVYASSVATPRNRAQVTFTNQCAEENTNELRITKRLASGSHADGDTFEFRVMLENADGELAAYYQGKYYIKDDKGIYYRYENNQLVPNGETKYELKAGNYGTIAGIPADFTVVIEDLVADTDFYVDEIRVHEAGANADKLIGNSSWTLENTELVNDGDQIGYDAPEITNAQIYDYVTEGNKKGSALGRIALGKDAQVVFTNKLNALDIRLQKVDNQNQPLNGAKFDLTKKNGQAWQAYVSNIEPTGENATVDMRSLRPGVYRLEETVTPKGYNILENKYVYFKVYQENGKYKVSLTNEAGDITNNEFAGISESNGTFLLKVKNNPGEELPQTGGVGTIAIYAMGAGLVVIATLGLAPKKMRNNL